MWLRIWFNSYWLINNLINFPTPNLIPPVHLNNYDASAFVLDSFKKHALCTLYLAAAAQCVCILMMLPARCVQAQEKFHTPSTQIFFILYKQKLRLLHPTLKN